jgi:hypothetical protein
MESQLQQLKQVMESKRNTNNSRKSSRWSNSNKKPLSMLDNKILILDKQHIYKNKKLSQPKLNNDTQSTDISTISEKENISLMGNQISKPI